MALSPETRIQLFQMQAAIRTAEEAIVRHYHEQEMRCPVHLCIGQEAVSAGACAAVLRSDYAISHHRSHGHYLGKGGNLNAMMAEIYGKATGCSGGKGGSMHLIDLDAGFLGAAPIVGSTIPIGLGAAFSAHLKKEDRVTLVFLGDGAMESGVVHESFNFAVLKKLPVVFVCENNLYSVNSPMHVRQSHVRRLVDIATGHGLPAADGDGNDAEAVYRLTKDATDRARRGDGPSFLEFSTYRWREHCGQNFDHPAGFRDEQEVVSWMERDPISIHRHALIDEKIAHPDELDRIYAAQEALAASAIEFAINSPFPDPNTAADHIYA